VGVLVGGLVGGGGGSPECLITSIAATDPSFVISAHVAQEGKTAQVMARKRGYDEIAVFLQQAAAATAADSDNRIQWAMQFKKVIDQIAMWVQFCELPSQRVQVEDAPAAAAPVTV
jgi:hypothetical protein